MNKLENTKGHWENIYQTKEPDEMSWTQDVSETSLEFVQNLNLPKSANIIDVGGGESKLVDFLLNEGFENISVLDISTKALDKTKKRLGKDAQKVKWITGDITEFKPDESYDLWHDRATFHFLITEPLIKRYIYAAENAVKENGYLIMGTFSTEGPEKCSGLEISQYSEESLAQHLDNGFEKIRCITEDHITPFNTKQNFLFCSFKRIHH
jgi:2-polyprenyl-3-methyl-5-hydroxy-6-metoxy-1,4-benzoquinol methylase